MRYSLRGYQHFGAGCASVKGGGDAWPEYGRAHLCEIVEPASQTTQQHVSEHRNLDVPQQANPKDGYCSFIGYSAALVQV
jgi:hypothetical protein